MSKNIFTNRFALAALAAVVGLSSCQTDEFENTADESLLVESSTAQAIENQYIVVLKKDAVNARFSPAGDYEQRSNAMKSLVLSMFSNARLSEDAIGSVYSSTIYGFTAKMDDATLARVRKNENVDYIEQDQMVMLSPPQGGDVSGSSAQVTPYGIARVNGGVSYSGDGVAYILDSGIQLNHEDLNVDASKGFNAFTRGRDGRSLDDGNGHGTHVAGTVAALDNNVGVIGVAAGATVVPVKVLDSRGSGSYSGVIAGVDFVGANGKPGDVANMSLGGPISEALDAAVKAASANGVWFVLAAGNDGRDANNSSPARATGPYIMTISAMDINDNFASFSNWGNPPVDFCQPGVSINSTWINGGYRSISGTSMAAPHAAGILLLSTEKKTDGTVNNDPDGNADPILVY